MKTIKCPDGRPVNIPKSQKCATKFYKDAVRDFQSNISATINVIDKVSIRLDSFPIGIKSKLLKDKLDNESIRMELILKSSFYGLLTDPCEGSKSHQALLMYVAQRNYQFEELRIAIEQKKDIPSIEKAISGFPTFEQLEAASRGNNKTTESDRQLQVEDTRDIAALKRLVMEIDNYYLTYKLYPLQVERFLLKFELQGVIYMVNEDQKEYEVRYRGVDLEFNTEDDLVYIGKSGTTYLKN